MHITDAPSGFDFGVLEIRSPSGGQFKNSCCSTFPRVSGDAQDGVYAQTFTLEQYSETGTWYVSSLSLMDAVGNEHTLSWEDLTALGLSAEFTVGPP